MATADHQDLIGLIHEKAAEGPGAPDEGIEVQIEPLPADPWNMWNYVYRRRRGLRTAVAKTQPVRPEDLQKLPKPVPIQASKTDALA